MNKIYVVALIGLMMTVGLALAGCIKGECPGSGQCTVTIKQGTSGLYVDDDSPRSSCGKTKTWDSSTSSYKGGCKVANMMNSSSDRRYGTQSCDCE